MRSEFASRSEKVSGGCRFVKYANFVLREERETKLDVDGSCFLGVSIERSYCHRLLSLGGLAKSALV